MDHYKEIAQNLVFLILTNYTYNTVKPIAKACHVELTENDFFEMQNHNSPKRKQLENAIFIFLQTEAIKAKMSKVKEVIQIISRPKAKDADSSFRFIDDLASPQASAIDTKEIPSWVHDLLQNIIQNYQELGTVTTKLNQVLQQEQQYVEAALENSEELDIFEIIKVGVVDKLDKGETIAEEITYQPSHTIPLSGGSPHMKVSIVDKALRIMKNEPYNTFKQDTTKFHEQYRLLQQRKHEYEGRLTTVRTTQQTLRSQYYSLENKIKEAEQQINEKNYFFHSDFPEVVQWMNNLSNNLPRPTPKAQLKKEESDEKSIQKPHSKLPISAEQEQMIHQAITLLYRLEPSFKLEPKDDQQFLTIKTAASTAF